VCGTVVLARMASSANNRKKKGVNPQGFWGGICPSSQLLCRTGGDTDESRPGTDSPKKVRQAAQKKERKRIGNGGIGNLGGKYVLTGKARNLKDGASPLQNVDRKAQGDFSIGKQRGCSKPKAGAKQHRRLFAPRPRKKSTVGKPYFH